MKKLKISLIALTKISLLCLVFFVLFPSIHVQAMFSDTVNINMGIKLELGTVNLAAEDTNIITPVSFTEGDPVLIAFSTLVNDGSLSGELAYKIDVTKEDGSIPTNDELKNTVISIDYGNSANNAEATASSLNSDSFTFVKNSNGSDVVIEPNSVGKVPVTVSYESSTPIKKEKLTVKVTFKLIQSNAADADANLFSDEVTMENVISLVPKVIEEKSYWPDKNTFINVEGKLSYSLEKMNMVFSEVYDKDDSSVKQIKNLNKAVLYIQIPRDEELKTIDKTTGELMDSFKVTSLVVDDTDKIKVEKTEIDEVNHGIKVTLDLEDSYDSSDPNKVIEFNNKFSYPINIRFKLAKYTFNGWNKSSYIYYAGVYKEISVFASRLVLSSDIPTQTSAANFEKRTISLLTKEKKIIINQLKTNWISWVENSHFENVLWTNEDIRLEVIGNNKINLISYLVNKDRTLSLWLNSNEILDDATLNVKITGDTGNTLVISRKLEMQKNAKIMKINSLIEEPLKEETKTQSNIEESEEDPVTEVENSTIVVEEPAKEVIEKPINESQEADEVVDPSSRETTIEINENIPEVTKEDKVTIDENE